MAEQSLKLKDTPQAIVHYKEAMKYSSNDINIMSALARIYMQSGLHSNCQDICASILKCDPNNDVASVIMADLSLRKMNFDEASYHFAQLLSNEPTNWTALARLIEVMRRAARLSEVIPYIERGEQNCSQSVSVPGLNYCKGLYEWYIGSPNSALRYFNIARRNSEWSQDSIYCMIEICLNPDGDLPNENMLDSDEEPDLRESRTMALRTADRLLKELKPSSIESNKFRMLTNFLHLSSRQKYYIEMAMSDFTMMMTEDDDNDNVGALLGLSVACILLKQSQRAKNHLKRVAKMNWTFEEAEYLERTWLILSDLYIQNGNLDKALNLLEQVIQHNKSSSKAYELWAQLAEKEQVYHTAAMRYDMAWKNCGKSKPLIGYKLAFNLMKNKKYAEAIAVCQQVLKFHPDYNIIKKDVLDKCRVNLKA